jgi:hypothetical protein
MNKNGVRVVFLVALIFILSVSGCISPPKETPLNATITKITAEVPTPIVITTGPTPVYVTIETPYLTPVPTYITEYRTIPTILPVNEDYVIIYSLKNQPFSYNRSAVSYDLKNPPMLIDFSLNVDKITRNVEGDSRVLTNEWTSYQTNTIDPNAFFEVIVREKSTGKIILQDGFGQSKQYGTENPRHLKIFGAGDYLIEFFGNKVLANVNLSVKREGNINQSIG